MDDWQLLDAYATRNSDEAFRALVDRYAGLVYHAALQRTGRPHTAEEITQAVFIALARKADRIPKRTVLSGWLFQATRFAALNLAREEARRQHYEQEAAMIEPQSQMDETESVWKRVSPLLYQALDQLSRKDREAVLIRFFQGKSHKEVGLALGVSEVTARSRVARAVDKLRSIFARQGLVTSAGTLGAALASLGAQNPPAGLTASVTTLAVAKGTAGTASMLLTTKGILKLMAWTKMKTAAVVGTVALLAIGTAYQKYEIHRAGRGLVSLRVVNAPLGDVIRRLERQTGQTIAWDRRLDGPVTVTVQNVPLPEVLNQVNLQAGAYWSVDYAIYDSKSALSQLESVLRGETDLRNAGWTNLSNGPHHFMFAGGSAEGKVSPNIETIGPTPETNRHDIVTLTVNLQEDRAQMRARMEALKAAQSAAASLPEGPEKAKAVREVLKLINPPGGPTDIILTAARAGTNEGILFPERLLTESGLLSRMEVELPVDATPENAARLAAKAHASWTTIYTLRQSPVEHVGIWVLHQCEPPPAHYTNFAQMIQYHQTKALTLSPEQRDAHARALAKLKEEH